MNKVTYFPLNFSLESVFNLLSNSDREKLRIVKEQVKLGKIMDPSSVQELEEKNLERPKQRPSLESFKPSGLHVPIGLHHLTHQVP